MHRPASEFPGGKEEDGPLHGGEFSGGDFPQEGKGKPLLCGKKEEGGDRSRIPGPLSGEEPPGGQGGTGASVYHGDDGEKVVGEAVYGFRALGGEEKRDQPQPPFSRARAV